LRPHPATGQSSALALPEDLAVRGPAVDVAHRYRPSIRSLSLARFPLLSDPMIANPCVLSASNKTSAGGWVTQNGPWPTMRWIHHPRTFAHPVARLDEFFQAIAFYGFGRLV